MRNQPIKDSSGTRNKPEREDEGNYHDAAAPQTESNGSALGATSGLPKRRQADYEYNTASSEADRARRLGSDASA